MAKEMPTARRRIDRYTDKTRKRPNLETADVERSTKIRLRRIMDKILRKTGYALLGLLFRRNSIQGRVPLSSVNSILIIPYGDAIGDLIVALPLARAIKRRDPACRIGVVTSERNESLIANDADIDAQYLFGGRKDLKNIRNLLRARRDRYDLVVNCHFDHLTDYGVFSTLAGPRSIRITADHPRRTHYLTFFSYLATRHRSTAHLAHLCLEMLEEVVEMTPPIKLWEAKPTLMVPKTIEEHVSGTVAELLLSVGATWYVLFNTQARNPFREWGSENIVDFARRFEERYPDGALLFSASPNRFEEVNALLSGKGLKRSQLFRTSYDLLELASLAENARLVFTPDTSLIHFGVAANVPTLILFPDRASLPVEWLPLQVPSRFFVPAIHGEPVASIPVDAVFEGFVELLEGKYRQSQTYFDARRTQHPFYQHETKDRTIEELKGEEFCL